MVDRRQTRFACGCFVVAFAAITVGGTGHGNPLVATTPTPHCGTTTTELIMAYAPAIDQLFADAAIVTLHNAGFELTARSEEGHQGV